MKLKQTLACLSLVAGLAACGPSDGYYDSMGNYHHGSDGHRHNTRYERDASVEPGFSGDSYRSNNFYTDNAARRGDSKRVVDYDSRRDLERVVYKRAGYYDYDGRYIPAERAPVIETSYFPARGKCRIWYPDRAAEDQPAVESCTRIQYRVPYGAYVVYGGR